MGVLAVVLMWVLACMRLECWLDGLWGRQGAGMLAGGECIARSSSKKIGHKLARRRFGKLVLGRCRIIKVHLGEGSEDSARGSAIQHPNPIFRCSVNTD